MREIAPGVTFLGYRIMRFVFDAQETQEKSGWNVYSEVAVAENSEGHWEGKLTLTMNFFPERETTGTVHLVAEAKFSGKDVDRERFTTLCRTQGAALLIHPLRQFVQDFLEKVRP